MRIYIPTRADWSAFFRGMREFRSSFTTHYDDCDLAVSYDCGREFAHVVTLRRYEA